MDDKRKLPKSLVKVQELQRQDTINKVLRAVTDIKNESRQVTISVLMEYTGISRSTFSKPHIRKLLAEYGYAMVDGTGCSPKRQVVSRVEVILYKDRQIEALKDKNVKIERECELLRGQIFLLMQRG